MIHIDIFSASVISIAFHVERCNW